MMKKKLLCPEVGGRVQLRGRPGRGVLRRVNERWCWVDWDADAPGPTIVHLDELQLVPT